MSRSFISLAVFGLLALTVPWWFVASVSDGEGLPDWVVYVLAMNLVFPLAIAWLLRRSWKRFESDECGDS